tara:strand:+ start:277 stop:486 length:210 start_codon:yes stop_codon:yes gene_type:complete
MNVKGEEYKKIIEDNMHLRTRINLMGDQIMKYLDRLYAHGTMHQDEKVKGLTSEARSLTYKLMSYDQQG